MEAIDGKLIHDRMGDSIAVMGPSREPVQYQDVELGGKYNYPYTFTLVVSNMKHGKAGEGSFQVRVFAQDMKAKLEMLNGKDAD